MLDVLSTRSLTLTELDRSLMEALVALEDFPLIVLRTHGVVK